MLSTWMTPERVTRVRITSQSPAIAPVCVAAETRAALLRPGWSKTMNCPAARARRANSKKRPGCRNCSTISDQNPSTFVPYQVINEILHSKRCLVTSRNRVRDENR